MITRRQFNRIASTVAAASLSPFGKASPNGSHKPTLPVHLFSKHVQFLDYADASSAAADMGFQGLDLTVRPKGHVLPENVTRDLPKAVAAVEKAGLKVEMITTAIVDPDDAYTSSILDTASDLGIKYYRTGYVSFSNPVNWQEDLDRHRDRFRRLAEMNAERGLHGCYQNHSGTRVGAYITDIAYMLREVDPDAMGCQYDIRHAVVEGGRAWPVGLEALRTYIRTIDIKDFLWKREDGDWTAAHVPIESGMVDFVAYFKKLHDLLIEPIASLHAEYDLGGAEHGKREVTLPRQEVLIALKKDLEATRRLWSQSFGDPI